MKCKIPDSKARFQIPFGIPSELYEIPAGVGPLDIIYGLTNGVVETSYQDREERAH